MQSQVQQCTSRACRYMLKKDLNFFCLRILAVCPSDNGLAKGGKLPPVAVAFAMLELRDAAHGQIPPPPFALRGQHGLRFALRATPIRRRLPTAKTRSTFCSDADTNSAADVARKSLELEWAIHALTNGTFVACVRWQNQLSSEHAPVVASRRQDQQIEQQTHHFQDPRPALSIGDWHSVFCVLDCSQTSLACEPVGAKNHQETRVSASQRQPKVDLHHSFFFICTHRFCCEENVKSCNKRAHLLTSFALIVWLRLQSLLMSIFDIHLSACQ